MKMKQALIAVAAVLVFAAANVNAQTVTLAISGSSAIWLEMGQASYSTPATLVSGTLYGECAYDDGLDGTKEFTLTDSRPTTAVTDTAHAWVTWTAPIVSGVTQCGGPTASSTIQIYVNTDSVVGNRCYFANPRCTITIATGSLTPSNQIASNETAPPSGIVNAINAGGGVSVNGAATDIRPEDAKFATLRALTNCGTPIVAGSQYLGLGYNVGGAQAHVGVSVAGSTFQGAGGGSSFHVLDFNLTGTDPIKTSNTIPAFTVIPVGAVPVVVFVNPGDEAGFGNLLFSNINRGVLAGFLDGSFGNVTDAIPATGLTPVGATVYVREPLSGTYNTMEYAIPNSIENQSSQDVGLFAKTNTAAGNTVPTYFCNTGTGAPLQNPLTETIARSAGVTSRRGRAIGTGNMVKAVTSSSPTADNLGYSFWSAANFGPSPLSPVTSQNAKYLTVDGVDPIQETWSDGVIPQSSNGLLSNVTLAHVRDGSYPIWSAVRVEGDTGITGGACGASPGVLRALVCQANAFLVGLGTPSQPDFIPYGTLGIVRSHFSPPGVTYPGNGGTPANGDAGTAESGGDVGGIVFNTTADIDWSNDNLINTGNTGRRQ